MPPEIEAAFELIRTYLRDHTPTRNDSIDRRVNRSESASFEALRRIQTWAERICEGGTDA